MRRSLLLLGAWCGAIGGCVRTPAEARVAAPPHLTFDALVRPLDRVPLGLGDTARLGQPVAVLPTAARIAVLDRTRAELRIYSRADGRLESLAGTAGDGPGQLRRPAALAPLDAGRFVVLDDGRRVLSVRDSVGRVLHEALLPEGSFTSVVPRLAAHHIVVAGRIHYGADSIRTRDLHEFDEGGRRVASYGVRDEPTSLWARAFATVFAAPAEGGIAMATLASREVRVLDRRGSVERTVSVADGWLPPLEFPSDRLLEHGTTQQGASVRVMQWARQHRLMNGLFPLAGDRLLVRVQAFDPAGARFFYYAVTDRTGTRAVSAPTRVNVLATRGDTLFWIASGPRGDAFVRGVLALATLSATVLPAAREGPAPSPVHPPG